MAATNGTGSIWQALLAFQAEGVKLQKDAINPHYKNSYISLDSLMGHVSPVLNKCGLVVLQMPTEVGGVPSLTTKLVHAGTGETVEATMPLALAKTDPQSQGSAITYARRYALMAFLGLVADEDTDGKPSAKPRSAQGTPRAAGAASEATTRAAAPAPTDDPAAKTKRDPQYATEAQTTRLWAIVREQGVPKDDVREIFERVTGQGSSAQIPKGKYDEVVAEIQSWVPFE